MYLNRSEKIDASTPFGSYLKHYYQPINSLQKELEFVDKRLDNNTYNIFRLFWYAFLRNNFYDNLERQYSFLKANVFLYYLNHRSSFRHFSYRETKNHVLKSMITAKNDTQDNYLLNILRALDTKLNNTDFLKICNWKNNLLIELEKYIVDLNSKENILLLEIFNLEKGCMKVNLKFSELIEELAGGYQLKHLYEFSVRENDKNFLWCLLILVRIKLWPDQVIFSKEKYCKYINTLFRRSKVSKNESTRKAFIQIIGYFDLDLALSQIQEFELN
ncbi:hypothetical protein [Marinifilum caeruleilacunae]|uniref:Uncharacterized protein n=1 Tax=Marinifilum caeruleilacunae TaxID=2499076 RepID=A0ABX1WUE3_9BACT|nr:hypothetical protein [Marinifilum caeruleilacunae]NOU59711.1 hypothetical protein [Marinifilum caeruleilacunae]